MKRVLVCILLIAFALMTMVSCSYQNNTSLVSSDIIREFQKKGGFRVVFSPDKANDSKITSAQIEATKEIFSYRLKHMGIVNSIITSDEAGNITVEIIYEKSLDLKRIQAIMDIVSKKGYFSTQEIDSIKY